MLPTTRRTPRLAGLALVAVTAMAVTGCGVLEDGSTAATYNGNRVTTDQVQDAVKDIAKAEPNANFDAQTAAIFLALRPRLNQMATSYGVGVSRDQAARTLGLSGATGAGIDTVQANLAFGALNENAGGKVALAKLLQTADIDLNPRYGAWKKGGQPGPAANNWLKKPAAPAAAPPAS
ncbi:hypothetical protein [Luteipulveratus mongoliensis]|uniref:Lipoprotein n=1 Tax=Luteipulveratus mongoliensis TaxID=571913 RepID=A0A0K1JH74_9MICO|nr:hypothetical protein [Luteipulveratus mongoliensis]AKU15938.1 hypothetical protein VV02_08850 [Luteipulveratus mongoliensis]